LEDAFYFLAGQVSLADESIHHVQHRRADNAFGLGQMVGHQPNRDGMMVLHVVQDFELGLTDGGATGYATSLTTTVVRLGVTTVVVKGKIVMSCWQGCCGLHHRAAGALIGGFLLGRGFRR
jgi:hypothetical protein